MSREITKKNAFTLVEMLIAVSIIGILSALFFPVVEGYIQNAKEATAKENLRVLRNAIEIYTVEHEGLPPGYNITSTSGNGDSFSFIVQMQFPTDIEGYADISGTDPSYCFGPYLPEIPANPFNGGTMVSIEGESILDDSGYIYNGTDRTIILYTSGTDSDGTPYSNY